MREILVSELFKELLGPRTGIFDEVLSSGKPITEFQTGILSPIDEDQSDTVRTNLVDGTVQTDTSTNNRSSTSTGFQDGNYDDSEITSMVNPSLNPQKTQNFYILCCV